MAQTQSTQLDVEGLMEAGRNAWRQWLDSVQEASANAGVKGWEQVYQDNLDAGEKAVNGALQAQADWVNRIRQDLKKSTMPQPIADLGGAYCGMLDVWLDARSQLWQGWFDAARSAETRFRQVFSTEQGAGQDPFAAWQDLSRRALASQGDWLRSLMPQVAAQASVETEEEVPPKKPNGAGKRASTGATAKTA